MIKKIAYFAILICLMVPLQVSAQPFTQLLSDSMQTRQGYMLVKISQDGKCDANAKIHIVYRLKRRQTIPTDNIPVAINRGVERLRAKCPEVRMIDVRVAANIWTLGNQYFRVSAEEDWQHRPLKKNEIYGMTSLPAMPEKFKQLVQAQKKLGIFRPKNPAHLITAYHTELCSERMGVSLVFWDSQKGYSQRMISGYFNGFSQDAVQALTKICPQVNIIDVRVAGPDLQQLKSQAFSKAKGWKKDHLANLAYRANFPLDIEDGRDMAAISIKDDNFSGAYWGTQWGKLEGTMSYPVNSFTVQGISFNGKWYEHGQSNQRCETSRKGFGYWGKFHFVVKKDGSLGAVKRTVCNDADNVAEKGTAWLPVSGMHGQKGANKIVSASGLAKAQLQQDQLKLQAANSGKIPKQDLNPLAHFGYAESKRVFQHKGVDYYYTREKHSSIHFAAVRDIGDDEPILDLDPKSIEYDGKSFVGFSLKKNALKTMKSFILPALLKHAGENNKVIINYYTKNKNLKNSKEMQRYSRLRVEPAIRVVFKKHNDNWNQVIYSKKRPYSDAKGYANTIRQAMMIRTERDVLYNEKQRVANLTPEQQAQERLAKFEAKDKMRRKISSKTGTAFRDWKYWQQYNYSNQYEGIFFGDYDADKYAGLFPHLYLRFFATYSVRCKDFVPENSPGYDYYTKTTYSNSYFKDEITRYDRSIRVKSHYWPAFKGYHENPPVEMVAPAMQAGLSGDVKGMWRNIKSLVNYSTSVNNDFDLMFNNEKCNGGFIRQMEDNFYHAATKTPYVQKQGKKMNYAANDKGGKFTVSSFYVSCISSEGRSGSNKRWCRCLDQGMNKSFTPAERAKYRNNYLQLMADTRELPRSAEGAEFRRFNMVQQCKN